MVWKSISQGKMQANQIINIILQYFLGKKKYNTFFSIKVVKCIYWGFRFSFCVVVILIFYEDDVCECLATTCRPGCQWPRCRQTACSTVHHCRRLAQRVCSVAWADHQAVSHLSNHYQLVLYIQTDSGSFVYQKLRKDFNPEKSWELFCCSS